MQNFYYTQKIRHFMDVWTALNMTARQFVTNMQILALDTVKTPSGIHMASAANTDRIHHLTNMVRG